MAGDAPTDSRPAEAAATTEMKVAPDAPAKDAAASAAAVKDAADKPAASADDKEAKEAAKDDAPTDPPAATKADAANDGGEKNGIGAASKDDAAAEPVKDDAAAAAAAAAAPEPKSAKKAAATPKAPSRKKSVGNVKGKATPKKNADLKLEPGNHVMAKMRSYPPWPSIVLNEELLPASLKDGPPKGGKTAPSKGWETHYPIMFLGTFEYAWIPVTDLDPVSDDRKAPSKKSKMLHAAFENLEQGFTLDDVKEWQSAPQADVVEDEMDVDEEEEAEAGEEEPESDEAKSKKKSKKRKASSDEEDTTPEKPAKTPKKDTKSKAKTPKSTAKSPKTPANGVAKPAAKPKTDKKTPAKADKKKATPAASAKRGSKAKSAETVVSDDEEEKPVDPSTLDEKDQRELMMHRRHKLQKAFLNKEGSLPTSDEMPLLSKCLQSLEEWTNLDAELIMSTKINKVLKGIIKLTAIPLDAEFAFKARSAALYDKWNAIMGAAEKKKENGVAEDAKPTDKAEESDAAKPVANGDESADKEGDVEMKDAEKIEKAEEKGDEKAGEKADEKKPETDEPSKAEKSEDKAEKPAEKDAAPKVDEAKVPEDAAAKPTEETAKNAEAAA